METHIVSYNCHVFTILRICWRTECYHFSVLLSPQPFSFFCGMFPSPTFCVPSQFVIRKRKWHILTLTHFDTPRMQQNIIFLSSKLKMQVFHFVIYPIYVTFALWLIRPRAIRSVFVDFYNSVCCLFDNNVPEVWPRKEQFHRINK